MPREELLCAREGLAAALRFDQLGAYDGADGWSLMIRNLHGLDQLSMTETHEALHHDLQWSSGWGLLSSGAQVLARNGARPHALRELFREMVESARHTHETFATTFSTTTIGVNAARQLLAGNAEYSAYLERGLALVAAADDVTWQFRSAAISSVLRVCMRPASTLGLLQRGFRDLRSADLVLERDAPDLRLAAFEQVGGPRSWQPVFDQLAAEFPDRGGDASGERHSMPIDSPEFERLRRFEEEILMPRCHAHACAVLDRAGLPSLGSRQQSVLANAFRTAVAAIDSEFASRIELVADRRPIFEDALEYHRQRLWLRERLPVELTSVEETRRTAKRFRSVSEGGRFLCGLWLDRQVARGQFDLGDDIPDLLTAIAALDDDEARLRLGLLPSGITPSECQRMLRDAPLLVLTTHHTLARHADVLAMLQKIEPVYVLMDLPVDRHVKQWIDGGILVRMTTVDVNAILPPDQQPRDGLTLLVLAVTRNHPFRFICLGGDVGIRILADQLRRRYQDQIVADPALLDEHRAAMAAVVGFVLRSWHVLQQGGPASPA